MSRYILFVFIFIHMVSCQLGPAPDIYDGPLCTGEDELLFGYRSDSLWPGPDKVSKFEMDNGESFFYLSRSCKYWYRDSASAYSWDDPEVHSRPIYSGVFTEAEAQGFMDNIHINELVHKYRNIFDYQPDNALDGGGGSTFYVPWKCCAMLEADNPDDKDLMSAMEYLARTRKSFGTKITEPQYRVVIVRAKEETPDFSGMYEWPLDRHPEDFTLPIEPYGCWSTSFLLSANESRQIDPMIWSQQSAKGRKEPHVSMSFSSTNGKVYWAHFRQSIPLEDENGYVVPDNVLTDWASCPY